MSKESGVNPDGWTSAHILTRRQVLLGGLALSLASCAPAVTGQSKQPENSNPLVAQPQNPAEPVSTATETKPNGPLEITAAMTEFVYADLIEPEEWKKVALGEGIPLPFGQKAFPLTIEAVTRRIKATKPVYGQWVGREIIDQILTFLLPENAEVVAFADGEMVLQPSNDDVHSVNTTRIEFHIPGVDLAYVYRIGGKNNIDWATEIPVYPAKYVPVKAGQLIGTITKPIKVPAQVLPDIVANVPSIYNMWLTQHSFNGDGSLASTFREVEGVVTASQLNLSSLRKSNQKYVGIYENIGK